ncbi:MAG: Gfo/Idh/MocA family oxidoreductase [Caldilineaceae bacterium]|nr:Gfo/Idh/MocA family oxidoreductase [Caldilineaceae bacterium]
MTTKPQVRVGFIGTGWTERVQIPMFRRGGLVAQAIASANPANAERVAHKLSIPQRYTDWRDLIAADNIDLVSIVTPPHLHAEMAIAALQAGKHVLCEKPMAVNVAEAEAMLAAAQAAPNQLALIDHELRFHPQRLHLRRLLREGYVGELIAIHLDRLGSERLNPTLPWAWGYSAEQGGGMLGALGSHLLDLARWFAGRIEAVTAQLQIGHQIRQEAATGNRRTVTADDHAHLLLHFAHHVQGTVTASGLTPGGYGMSITIIGTQGALRLDNRDQLWGAQGSDLHEGKWQPIASELPTELADRHGASPFTIGSYYLAKLLADALPEGRVLLQEPASFYDGLAVQRALDAARQSAREQRWIQL